MQFSRWIFFALLICALSGLVVAVSWYVNYKAVQYSALEMVRIKGQALFQLVQTTRLWNSNHGGVYVPVTENSKPNPYLYVHDRDVTDSTGRQLTKVNPAYMTRQISELLKESDGVDARLTSLRPLNPINRADLWETEKLQLFDSGVQEGVVGKEERRYRYIAPLLVKQSCLECHASQGYQVGDVRGALSISFPMEDIDELVQNLESQADNTHWFAFLSLSVVGVSALLLVVGLSSKLESSVQRRKKLESEIRLDGLTGVLNHKSVMTEADREFKRSFRQLQHFSVLMLDIDHFKQVNDTYGHQDGDQVLRAVAKLIGEQLREVDSLGRYGGEEFVVLLPDSKANGAWTVAERIRSRIENRVITVTEDGIEKQISLTISIGIAERKQNHCTDMASLLEKADQALYVAKKSGRNRSEVAE